MINIYNISFIISGLNTGGAEMMLSRLLSGMDRDAFNPTVISLGGPSPLAAQIEDSGIIVHSLDMARGRVPAAGLVDITRLIQQSQPDIVQGWMYHGNIAATTAQLMKRSKKPLFWNIRGITDDLKNEKALTAWTVRLGARLSRFPRWIITNSYRSIDVHTNELNYKSNNWVMIPNGFDTGRFSPRDEARSRLRRELKLGDDAFLIGIVGRYHRCKDYDNFLEAASAYLGRFDGSQPQAHFVLVGRNIDSRNAELRTKIVRLGLENYVHLLGERSDIAYLNAGFDIATSSSYSESFPNVIGEAMSCGIPCVVTDTGDSARLVGDTGMVVPVRQPGELSQAWMRMISLDPGVRRELGAKARQRIIDNYSIAEIVKKYERLYFGILGNAKRASGTAHG